MTDQNNTQPTAPFAREQTGRETLLKEMATNPRWKETPRNGQGFVIRLR